MVDFYCHATRLVVELDGGVHQRQADYDAERDRVLASRALQIARIRNEDIRQNLGDVLARLFAVSQSLAKEAA